MNQTAVEDLFAPFGRVEIRKMFGAFGVYHQGLIIGCLIHGLIYLKTDAETESQFIAAGGQPWHYVHAAGGKQVRMPYCTLPEPALDDENEFRHWCVLALAAAQRAEVAKKPKPAKRLKAAKKSA